MDGENKLNEFRNKVWVSEIVWGAGDCDEKGEHVGMLLQRLMQEGKRMLRDENCVLHQVFEQTLVQTAPSPWRIGIKRKNRRFWVGRR